MPIQNLITIGEVGADITKAIETITAMFTALMTMSGQVFDLFLQEPILIFALTITIAGAVIGFVTQLTNG